ncbi:MAG TPA: LPS assembly protein LptD [Nitrospiria bacterium]|nr:LPS assembly protein LptD [Nitrospiria bacterium]
MRLCPGSLLVFFLLVLSQANIFAQPVVPSLPEGKGPINISSDRLEYLRKEDIYAFDGHVVITQDKFQLKADHAEFDSKTGGVHADGNVEVFDGENQLTGEELDFDINTRNGVVYTGTILIKKEGYHIDGEVLERLGETRYHLHNGFFTACELKQGISPDWHFKARDMDLDTNKDLIVKSAVLYVKDMPIMYIPYISYPAKKKSGLLTPSIAYSTTEGLKIKEGLYWVIADNHDATVSLDYRSDKGRGVDLEYRYLLSRDTGGKFDVKYFRDLDTESDRADLKFRHQQLITEDLQIKVDARYLSDSSIFRDLSDITEERIQRSIESNAIASNRFDDSFLYLFGRYTKALDEGGSLVPQKVPEIGYSIIEKRTPLIPAFYSVDMTGAYLFEQEGIDAQRYDINARVGMGVDLSGLLVLTPSIDLRETVYSRGETSMDAIGREIYRASLEANTNVSKDINLSDNLHIRHVVEPAAIYEYIPDLDQSGIHIFDDLDRIPSKDLITYSLINRFIARYPSGEGGEVRRLEFLYVKMTQSYNRADQSPLSDMRLEVAIKPPAYLSIDVDSFYDLYEGRISSFNSNLGVPLGKYLNLSIGQRYTKEGEIPKKGDIFNPFSLGEQVDMPEIRFLTWSASINPVAGLSLSNIAYYDLLADRFAEIDYVLSYNPGCWWLSITYMDLPEKNQIFFLFGLKGLGMLE